MPLSKLSQLSFKRVRNLYVALAMLHLLILAATGYLSLRLSESYAAAHQANQRWAAMVASVATIGDVVDEADAPANDVFARGGVEAERELLHTARGKFRASLAQARSRIGPDPEITPRLNRTAFEMAGMNAASEEVLRLVSLNRVADAAVSIARLDQQHERVQAEMRAITGILRGRQLAAFEAQSRRTGAMARHQRIGLGVLALIVVVAMFFYERLLGREVVSARERDEAIRLMQKREAALRVSIAERDTQREQLVRERETMADAERFGSLGAFDFDVVADKLWWSDEMYSLFGVRRGEYEPSFEKFMAMVRPNDRQKVLDGIAEAVALHRPFSFEIHIVAADGRERILSSFGRVDVGDDGQPLRMRGIGQDITDRKWAEEQLLRQEAQLAEAQRIARMGSWEFEVETREVTWSDELHSLLGYQSGETEPSFRAYMSLLPPDEKKRVYALLEDAMEGGDDFAFEHTLIRRDGIAIDVFVEGVIDRDREGRPIRVLGVSQDVTLRKKSDEALRLSEERFQLASRATNDTLWDWNLTNHTIWVNEAFSTQFGYAWTGVIDSRMREESIHPDDRAQICTSISEAIDGGAEDWTAEYRFRDGRGAWHDVLDRAYIVRDASGKALRMIGAMMDVTEQRKVEKMKDEFISTVSHELRTPLTSIRGALGLLASGRLGTLPEKGQRLVDIASANTDRLVRLINDILDIERIEAGKVTLTKIRCDAGELLVQAADTVRSLAEKGEIGIRIEAGSIALMADPDRLIQALTNLLGNAVKFSPRGSEITLTASPRGDNVALSVSDRGRGIPPEKLASIFERFQQVDASDARDKGGSGLGLAISRSIVRQHGGEISVESVFGGGSTFTIVVPRGITVTEPARETPSRLVYLCDDDSDTRDVMKFLLAGRGYSIRETASGVELLDAVAEERPDAILLDLFMPAINGWETLARLKSDPATADVPVVVVSVLSREETGEHGLEIAGWIQKPLEETSLAGAVERAFGARARRPSLVLVEDDDDLASVINASFERLGIETLRARNGLEAIAMAQNVTPDLLVLDLGLPELDGYGVVDWLKDHHAWRSVPVVVYSGAETSPSQRKRLQLGYTEFMTKGRVTPDQFERRIVSLIDVLSPGTRRLNHEA